MPRRWMRSFGQARDAVPGVGGLVVVQVDGDPDRLGVEAEPAVLDRPGDQLPGVLDRAFLEVVAEGEVAVHLEERAVPGGLAHLLDVEGAHALLHAGGARVGRRLAAGQVRDERHHAGDGEQQRRVRRDQRGTGDDGVPALGEVLEEAAADLGGLHRLLGSAGPDGGCRLPGRGEGSAARRRARRPAGQPDLVAGRQRRVQAGARRAARPPARPRRRGRRRRSRRWRRRGRAAPRRSTGRCRRGVIFSAARAQLADDEHADGDAHGQPEQPAHQAARRAARRARRASLSRCAASASAWPSRFFLAALRTP